MPISNLVHLDSFPIYNPETFERLATLRPEFEAAFPFRHVVIDHLFNPDLLRAIEREFYHPSDPRWFEYKNAREKKLALEGDDKLPPLIKAFVRELNSDGFLRRLSAVTGIEGLIPDPYLIGGGMHQIVRGGKLSIHTDFNKHELMKVDRRLNLIVYLNEDWDESYGGHLELWDREMKTCGQRILPIFNRSVLFLTDDFSYHGHPDALQCPDDRARRSIAMYYYTNGRPEEELSNVDHTTVFKMRPDERFDDHLIFSAKQALHRYAPKTVLELARKVLRRS